MEKKDNEEEESEDVKSLKEEVGNLKEKLAESRTGMFSVTKNN